MHIFHHILKHYRRQLLRSPRPLAYNYHQTLRPALGPLLAYLKLKYPDYPFIQIGANDGKRSDPIHEYVETFQLTGILLEPQPELFQELQRTYAHRNDLTLLQAALADKDETLNLYRLRPDQASLNTWATGIASFNKEVFLHNAARHGASEDRIETIPVEAISVNTLLTKYQIAKIGLLQIDTEGYDAEVLRLFDIAQTRPLIIHYEHKHLPQHVWEHSISMLLKHNYLVSHNFEDTLACLRGFFPE